MAYAVVSFTPIVALLLAALALAEPKKYELGAKLYAEHCASCHGANLEGQPNWQSRNPDGTLPAPPHDRTGHTWHHEDNLLFDYVKSGGQAALEKRGVVNFKSGMPAFDALLSDEEIWIVIDFVKSKWGIREREYQRSVNQIVK